tara:strand:- start:259 stop:1881 length:1623 start_codon:yes stop_codon:yes gene_type:complete
MFIIGQRAGNVTEYEDALTQLEQLIGFDFSRVNDYESYNVLFSMLDASNSAATTLIGMCNNSSYNSMLLSDVSTGTYMEMRLKIEALPSYNVSLQVKSTIDDAKILSAAWDDTTHIDATTHDTTHDTTRTDITHTDTNRTDTNRIDTAYAFLLKNPPNKFTNYIAMRILESDTDKYRKAKVSKQIEKQIDTTLQSTRIPVAFPIVRYGLKPGPPLSYDEAIAMKGNAGLVIINHGIETTVVFDMRGLVDRDYIVKNDLKVNKLAGINKKYIKRFTTIVDVGDDSVGGISVGDSGDSVGGITTDVGVDSPVTRTIYSITHGESKNEYIVLSKGPVWRVLYNEETYIHSAESIKGLLSGITTRPTDYARACVSAVKQFSLQSKYAGFYNENAKMKISQYVASVGVVESADYIIERVIDYLIGKLPLNATSYQDVINNISDLKPHIEYILPELIKPKKARADSVAGESLISHTIRISALSTLFLGNLQFHADRDFLPKKYFNDKESIKQVYMRILTASAQKLNSLHAWTASDYSFKEFLLADV